MSDVNWCEIDDVGGAIEIKCDGEERKYCYPATDGVGLEVKVAATGGGIDRTKTRMKCESWSDLIDR